jgi:hypothetical protein
MLENFTTQAKTIEKKFSKEIEKGFISVSEDRYTIKVLVKPPSLFRGAASVQKYLRENGFSYSRFGEYEVKKSKVHDLSVKTIDFSKIDTSEIKSIEGNAFLKQRTDSNGQVDVEGFKSDMMYIADQIKKEVEIISQI